MKKIFLIVAAVAIMLPIMVLAQSSANITSPSYDGISVPYGNVQVSGTSSGANSTWIHLRNTTTDQRVDLGSGANYGHQISTSSSFSFSIPQSKLVAGHSYRVTIETVSSAGSSWKERTFKVASPQPNQPPPAQPQYSTSRINDYRWTIQNANVYSDLNLSNRKTTLNKGTKVYVSEKYTYSNGKVVAKINEGYVNANDLGTAEPTPTQQSVNAYRWIIANPANVYNDWNLTSRKMTLSKGAKVYVSTKYFLSNGTQVAKINEGYVNANDLGTAEPTPTQQDVNAYRWIIASPANVYNDWNLTSRKATLSKGTKVYVSTKYILSNGTQVAKINEGYVNANDLGTTEPTPTQQSVNAYRWIIANPASVYNDWNLTSRKTTLSKGTKVYASYKYILSNGTQVAKINEGYVNANDLGTAEPTPTRDKNSLQGTYTVPIPTNGGVFKYSSGDLIAIYIPVSFLRQTEINAAQGNFNNLPPALRTDIEKGRYKDVADMIALYSQQLGYSMPDPTLGGAVIMGGQAIQLVIYSLIIYDNVRSTVGTTIIDGANQLTYFINNELVNKINGYVNTKNDGYVIIPLNNLDLLLSGVDYTNETGVRAMNGQNMVAITDLNSSENLKINKILSKFFLRSENIKVQSNNSTVQPITLTSQPQTYTTSNFTRISSAILSSYSGHNYIGMINATNGFRFSVNSSNAKTVKLSILYRSDNRNGKLIINGVAQYVSFPSTNWNWGTKEVQVQLRQGANTIEFYGGYPKQTDYAPDIAEITIK